MKKIKLLHMFPRLLSLYGEYGSLALLTDLLEKAGYQVERTAYEGGELSLEADLIYVGAGTEDNLLEAAARLQPYAQAIRESIEAGTLWLATGNAMTLFGKEISRKDRVTPGVAAFDYTTTLDDSRRFLGDALTQDTPATLGFVNTSCLYHGVESPWFTLKLGAQLGNDKKTPAEGIRAGSFHGTQLLGPLLTKNPHLLQYFYEKLTGEALELPEEDHLQKAYHLSSTELSHRGI